MEGVNELRTGFKKLIQEFKKIAIPKGDKPIKNKTSSENSSGGENSDDEIPRPVTVAEDGSQPGAIAEVVRSESKCKNNQVRNCRRSVHTGTAAEGLSLVMVPAPSPKPPDTDSWVVLGPHRRC
ncbi:hypothetical protein TSUD_218080 [Trifolium subterraneum]|uniref:Uncharacterized protein n=1 Tax=Trifolium subterraneum TaxID=3900 RepID=A0A2Z6MRB1_TRISU|nr:hypothetical protein TSUD_218080 [Trifolium subterraneum]